MSSATGKLGTHFSANDLRGLFATASLRAEMNVVVVQNLLGCSSLEVTLRHLSIIEDDLLYAHEQYGPVDRALR